ncbi:hypothetical protein SISNIDRAFT_492876 [Sistotremastrum niveocremeum HHB9708]|uniref:Uncharacterized protein n=1 Tax=Sistotremastrum niveocremeum HHB9708 TaxID=1314777 RepID=A0A165A9N1_9AGAM|nr:hypothetical protein SISNIDRAFT_492876 [Sistotremastrum niveocremeum HHB9708]
MSIYADDVVRDRINLHRIVRRLEQNVFENGADASADKFSTWIKSRSTMQTILYAKSLLGSLKLHGEYSSTSPSYNPAQELSLNSLQKTLDALEETVSSTEKKYRITPSPPSSILAQIPIPQAPKVDIVETEPPVEVVEVAPSKPEDLLPHAQNGISDGLSPNDLLLPENDPSPSPPPAMLKPTPSVSTLPSEKSSALWETSLQTQDLLTEQMVLMAAQMKLNAHRFADSLEKDKAAINDAQVKVEGNYDLMVKQRTRLRDHSVTSRGSTWMTLTAVVAVLIAFVIMVLIIRVT